MNIMHEKMEKEVVSLLFREYSDLQSQIYRARITDREFTGVGFFTNYHEDDVLCEEEMVISGVGGVLNNSIEVGFVFFIRRDGAALECYTYGDDSFPDQIESYELFIY